MAFLPFLCGFKFITCSTCSNIMLLYNWNVHKTNLKTFIVLWIIEAKELCSFCYRYTAQEFVCAIPLLIIVNIIIIIVVVSVVIVDVIVRSTSAKHGNLHWFDLIFQQYQNDINSNQCLLNEMFSSSITCLTTAWRLVFWYLRSNTRPATTSDGTTSNSRKKSLSRRAISANEFRLCSDELIQQNNRRHRWSQLSW